MGAVTWAITKPLSISTLKPHYSDPAFVKSPRHRHWIHAKSLNKTWAHFLLLLAFSWLLDVQNLKSPTLYSARLVWWWRQAVKGRSGDQSKLFWVLVCLATCQDAEYQKRLGGQRLTAWRFPPIADNDLWTPRRLCSPQHYHRVTAEPRRAAR